MSSRGGSNSPKEVRVTSHARLHVALLNLGDATLRRYGGVGFSLDYAAARCSTGADGQTRLEISDADSAAEADLHEACRRLESHIGAGLGTLHVEFLAPQHIGLGTKTAAVLATLHAAALRTETGLSVQVIQALSGRGGASGIGLNGFVTGGLIVDAGHRAETSLVFGPSSSVRPDTLPLVISRQEIPAQWRFHLIAPPNPEKYHGERELIFFRENTPIPAPHVHLAVTLVHHELVPAVIENDFTSLKRTIARLQRVGFKSVELSAQVAGVKAAIRELNELNDCAAGLSSIGPMIYAIVPTEDHLIAAEINKIAITNGLHVHGIVRGRNKGALVETVGDH